MFGVKILKFMKSNFKRQILESVLIQDNREHNLMNSKTEYNRCAVPRLTIKLGENVFKKWEENDKDEEKC